MTAWVAAFWLIQPGICVLGDHSDIAVAIGAVHGEIGGHGIAQALGTWPRVAVIAAGGIGGDIWYEGGVMMPVHGIGHIFNFTHRRCSGSVRSMAPIAVHGLMIKQGCFG